MRDDHNRVAHHQQAPVPPESRNALTKERVFFIGWLKAQK